MVVILYSKDTFGMTGRVKLGGADKLYVEKHALMDMGTHFDMHSGEVYFEGYDPLVTQSQAEARVTPVTADERKSYETVIAAMLHVMGGSLTFQPHEMHEAQKRNVQVSYQQDPYMFVVKLEEKK